MGGRGASAGRAAGGGGGGGLGGLFTVGANGGATITPPNQNPNPNPQNITNAGAGVSDVKTHTTYFTPADYATVGPTLTDGWRRSPRTGNMVPVGYYQTGDYANINGELRDLGAGKRTNLTPQTQKVVDAMDRNMRPLNADIDSTRWTDVRALADNIGMKGANSQQIIRRLTGSDVIKIKDDYTSSSWNENDNVLAGVAGRNVKINMHYKKGAMAQFSPTGKEGEMVGARGKPQRFANARIERVLQKNARTGNRYVDVLVVDCYVDS